MHYKASGARRHACELSPSQEAELSSLFKGANKDLALAMVNITHEMRAYWPLTVRQVYYQAVSRLLVANKLNEYRKTSRILTTLRRNDLLPWSAIEDRTRRTFAKRGRPNVLEYIESEMWGFLNPDVYGRCYIQDQDVYVEVATEKDALSSILSDAVWMYCTRLNVVKGQVSATMVNAMAERFDKAIMLGKRPILLYLGDLDPSGIAIPKALVRNMTDWHSVDVELQRVALNPEQAELFSLPVSIEAAKKTDPNYAAWLREYGDQSPFELDAIHPRDLTRITQDALNSVYDMSGVEEQKRREAAERRLLKRMRQDVEAFVMERYRPVFDSLDDLGTSAKIDELLQEVAR